MLFGIVSFQINTYIQKYISFQSEDDAGSENLKDVKKLLNRGANIEAKDCDSWTPIFIGKMNKMNSFSKFCFIIFT